VCLDIATLENTEMLEEGFAITPDHIEAACERQEIEIRARDVVLFHTGWSKLWKVDTDRYGALEPGLGWDAAHWLTDRRISLAGADNWCLEVWPPAKEGCPLVVHQHLLCETGTYIIENLKTKELVDNRHWEFLFLLSPNKTKGSTGSMARSGLIRAAPRTEPGEVRAGPRSGRSRRPASSAGSRCDA
jgi:kynurenine formamidase